MSDEVYDWVVARLGDKPASYTTLPCRLLGISYPDYLRVVRDIYGAQVWGRTQKGPYVSYMFPDRKKCLELCTELNKRWQYMKERWND